jgi:hypothetical protein
MQSFYRFKRDLQKDFATAGYLFEAPSPSRFFALGRVSNFLGSESGHINTLECKTPAEYGLQHDSTHPPATNCLRSFDRKGGGYWK